MKKLISLLTTLLLCLCFLACGGNSSPNLRSEPQKQEIWGDLVEREGGYVYNTLIPEQQNLVNYPKLDKSKVYWTPNGKSYHAVDYCYTLSRSKEIISGTLERAFSLGKYDPCSKCVEH